MKREINRAKPLNRVALNVDRIERNCAVIESGTISLTYAGLFRWQQCRELRRVSMDTFGDLARIPLLVELRPGFLPALGLGSLLLFATRHVWLRLDCLTADYRLNSLSECLRENFSLAELQWRWTDWSSLLFVILFLCFFYGIVFRALSRSINSYGFNPAGKFETANGTKRKFR